MLFTLRRFCLYRNKTVSMDVFHRGFYNKGTQGAKEGKAIAHEILSAKLNEMDGKIGRMHSCILCNFFLRILLAPTSFPMITSKLMLKNEEYSTQCAVKAAYRSTISTR